MTTNLHTTVGGTHSVGGVGRASFRYGSQADVCLSVEVVRPTGEVVWCSIRENEQLFDYTLCGLGQFGIITKLKIPIRRFEPKAKVFFAGYSSLGQFITAIRRMMSMACPGVVDLAGTIEVRKGRTLLSTGTGNRYIVQYTVESGTFGECDDAAESLDGGVVARNAREVDTRTLALAKLDGALEKSRWNRHIVDPGFIAFFHPRMRSAVLRTYCIDSREHQQSREPSSIICCLHFVIVSRSPSSRFPRTTWFSSLVAPQDGRGVSGRSTLLS